MSKRKKLKKLNRIHAADSTQARKAAVKAALAKRLKNRPKMVLVEASGDLQIYVKELTAADTDQIALETEKLEQQYRDDDKLNVRLFALELFDADGERYFDPYNEDDMDLLAALPALVRQSLQYATISINGGGGGLLKNLLAGGSSN